MKEDFFTTADGKKLACTLWDNTEGSQCVQIIHGMSEHVGRYAEFAKFLNEKGYTVFGDDHRAHGRTAGSIGLIGKPDGEADLFAKSVEDELAISAMLTEKYGKAPIIFAHSYGSFIAQRMLELTDINYPAVILCGSGKYPRPLLLPAYGYTALLCKMFSPEDEAKLVQGLSPHSKKSYWFTRDLARAKDFAADPYCDKTFSYGFFHSLVGGLLMLRDKEPKDVPMLIISGNKDSVGGYGHFTLSLHKYYSKKLSKLEMIVYEGAKHTLLEEINREDVMQDVLAFMKRNVK
jgi:alpha-beta hydrolase superfamily lysophospholipase